VAVCPAKPEGFKFKRRFDRLKAPSLSRGKFKHMVARGSRIGGYTFA
jgi:hypothetical protein